MQAANAERTTARSIIRSMRPPRPRQQVIAYGISLAGTLALTSVFLPFRDQIAPLAKGFGFLVVVVAAAGMGGIGPGVFASFLGFVVFNFFFLPPYNTFLIGRPEYVVVLFVNLGLSVVISVLLGRSTERAHAAEDREAELRTLQDLSRDLVVRQPGPEAYQHIVERVLETFGYERGALFVQDGLSGLTESICVGAPSGSISVGWDPRSAARPPERLPLSIGSRNVGLLVLEGPRDAPTPAESRILRAFGDQLALVLERDRLLRAATESEVYRQTENLRQTLFAAVSHDLRSPLSAIKATVTDLLDDSVRRPDADRREALEAIDSEAERLNALIANLLDMSRIQSGILQARPEGIDLAEAAEASARQVARVWPDIGIDVRVVDGMFARADGMFLDRVLTNLLDNAARSAHATGTGVEVTARDEGGRVTIRVIDHGVGVPVERHEALFHPFYELDRENPRLGRGIGLAIAKGFVVAMGGEIWLEDTPAGGATFAVELPGIEPASPRPPALMEADR